MSPVAPRRASAPFLFGRHRHWLRYAPRGCVSCLVGVVAWLLHALQMGPRWLQSFVVVGRSRGSQCRLMVAVSSLIGRVRVSFLVGHVLLLAGRRRSCLAPLAPRRLLTSRSSQGMACSSCLAPRVSLLVGHGSLLLLLVSRSSLASSLALPRSTGLVGH
ncbi:hypothetical protein BDZ89DRAFT_501237 [Hymenopellis radicata]|nr:hypothetical protein BDZ89DRAFT_501237 [Hymenopellis radicata]